MGEVSDVVGRKVVTREDGRIVVVWAASCQMPVIP
jgi:hypothetical protein